MSASRRWAGVLVVGVALLLPLLAGCSKKEGKALPDPQPSETTTTTDPIDLTSVSLEPIAVKGKGEIEAWYVIRERLPTRLTA